MLTALSRLPPTCAMAAALSPRSSATRAMPRSACWWMETGLEPLISAKAASPSVTQPASTLKCVSASSRRLMRRRALAKTRRSDSAI
jgi:hypothetical protein